MELPTPRPPRYNSEIFIVSCVLYFFFLSVCGLFVLALFVSKTSTSEARTVTFDLPLIAVPGACPVAVFGVAFFPDFLGRRHRKLVANSCAATGHSATQREAQHAAVAASSDKVVSTWRRADKLQQLSPTQRDARQLLLQAQRSIGHHRCTFDPWRCANELQHSAPCRLTGADSVPLTLGAARTIRSTPRHGVYSFDPWR